MVSPFVASGNTGITVAGIERDALKPARPNHFMSTQDQPDIQIASLPLSGKKALVTGGTRGIGRAVALKLARAGSDVAIVYHNSHDEAEAVCAAIRQFGRQAHAMQADVSEPELVAEVFAEVRQQFGRLDLLVSNAATGVLRPALELSLKHWRRCLETNALALNLLAQQAIPLMPEGGRIIALSSLGASRAIPLYAFIGASKAALESLVRSLAQELGPRGIRVNVVSAGVVDTDALKHFPNREQLLAEFGRRTPAGPTLTPEAVADAVYLLCLPEAGMITGHTLVVDGGYCISG
jgi:enoyl-[acyl-carrier protein] reductase III